MSQVSVLVMVCTAIGASPPTGTLPTHILRLLRRCIGFSACMITLLRIMTLVTACIDWTQDNYVSDRSPRKWHVLCRHGWWPTECSTIIGVKCGSFGLVDLAGLGG